jgi:hypothetical protein
MPIQADWPMQEPEPFREEDAWLNVIRAKRECECFEPFVSGATLTWHIDAQQRRRERRAELWWRAAFLVGGVLLGVAATSIARLLGW